jgi:hypothetical protein
MGNAYEVEMSEEYQSKTRRPQHSGCRFSEAEYALVSGAAASANIPIAEWIRRTVLDALESPSDAPPPMVLHEEIQFIKLILMNTLPKLLGGKTVPEEKTLELMLRLKDEKANLARQMVSESQSRKP